MVLDHAGTALGAGVHGYVWLHLASLHREDRTMQIITRQRCLRAANYRYSWRSSVIMIALALLTWAGVAYQAVVAIEDEVADVATN
mgnify:CR=1 FL=1